MAPVTPPSVPAEQPPSVYEVGGPSTVIAEGPYFPHLALGLSVPSFVSNAEVAASVTIRELGPRIYAVEGQMVMPAIKEVADSVAEAKKEQVIAPVVDMEEGQMDVWIIDMEEDLAVLFGEDDDFEDDDYEGLGIYAVEGQVQVMASQMVYSTDI
nr:hypothetical protein [Tanacetum cinerariifolium]